MHPTLIHLRPLVLDTHWDLLYKVFESGTSHLSCTNLSDCSSRWVQEVQYFPIQEAWDHIHVLARPASTFIYYPVALIPYLVSQCKDERLWPQLSITSTALIEEALPSMVSTFYLRQPHRGLQDCEYPAKQIRSVCRHHGCAHRRIMIPSTATRYDNAIEALLPNYSNCGHAFCIICLHACEMWDRRPVKWKLKTEFFSLSTIYRSHQIRRYLILLSLSNGRN